MLDNIWVFHARRVELWSKREAAFENFRLSGQQSVWWPPNCLTWEVAGDKVPRLLHHHQGLERGLQEQGGAGAQDSCRGNVVEKMGRSMLELLTDARLRLRCCPGQ